MKVLFVRSGNHGADPISTNQGNSLVREGIDVQFFDITGRGLTGYVSNILRLKRAIKAFNPDIIHSHYSLSSILTSLTLTRKPVVSSLMGSDIYLFGKFMTLMIRLFARYCWSVTIVKSQSLHSKAGIKDAIVIPNGVNFDDFKIIGKAEARSILGWDNKIRHIIFASDPGRAEKNYMLAEGAFKKLKERSIDFEIHFLNGIEYSEIVNYYCAADVLVMTSLYEGSPNSIKEAMVCNCPVVSTDVGDVREIMQGTIGTFIVENEVVSVTGALIKALEFDGRTSGRELLGEYDSRVIANKLISVYTKILNMNK